MTTKEEKVFEDRLRRMAQRQGLIAIKSRTRDPNAAFYNSWKFVKAQSKISVAGHSNDFCLEAWQVGKFLTKREWQ
jgi:hypothetical protein